MNKIPKKIHYFWFGNNSKPEIVNKCINSWRELMPDFEIIEWNEGNYDVHCCKYVEQAYEAKKWAFVSDYARFDILYKFGGLYMDTDVELLKAIPIKYFKNPFTAVDSNGKVAPGLVIALPRNHWLAESIVESYKSNSFNKSDYTVDSTINTRVNNFLKSKGFKEKDGFQMVNDLYIYPSVQFCGFDVNLNEYAITVDTIAVHHFAGSWMNSKQIIKRKVQKLIKLFFGIRGYKIILNIKRMIWGISK